MPETLSETAIRNDAIRAALPFHHEADKVLVTNGITALGEDVVFEAMTKAKSFDTFTEDNNPWGDRDFGSFELSTGDKAFWKVDDYGGHDGIRCVFTLLLASEY